MGKGVWLRRRMRAWGKRRAAASRRRGRSAARTVSENSRGVQRRFWQTVVWGALFVSLVLLKIVVPGNLSAFRGTLAQWLVRDADFAEAFSAVGQVAAAPEQLVESLGSAYVAVFGAGEATEVGGEEPLAVPDGAAARETRVLPDYASAEQPELPFAHASPLDGVLTSPFGWREDPNTGAEGFHTGLDLAADEGTAFAAFADGTVGVVGESAVLGKYLTVLHAEGFETLYAHCSKISVAAGQSVARGDALGAVGATGNATGAHLHFELLRGAKYLDPAPYVGDAA